MPVDVVVSRELKSLQEELTASRRERLAPPAASSATEPAGEPLKETARGAGRARCVRVHGRYW
jgi:hypothetical protein